jgi:hypothetical protein
LPNLRIQLAQQFKSSSVLQSITSASQGPGWISYVRFKIFGDIPGSLAKIIDPKLLEQVRIVQETNMSHPLFCHYQHIHSTEGTNERGAILFKVSLPEVYCLVDVKRSPCKMVDITHSISLVLETLVKLLPAPKALN